MKTQQPLNIRLMLLLILLVSVAKIVLINKGFLAFPDEGRYRAAGQILKSLANADWHAAIEFLFSTKGRPGDTTLKIVPTVLQYGNASLFGLEIYEPANSWPVFAYNLAIHALLLLLHYRVSRHFLKDRFLALFSVLVFATLVVSYISLRHADPYDASLLILYYVFYKLVSTNGVTTRKMFVYGGLAFFGYLCYPGYVLLFLAIPLVYLIRKISTSGSAKAFSRVLAFAAGSSVCLVVFEALAQIGGTSFIKNSLLLSGTIVQGSFEECFSFVFRYLCEAEGINGVFLIIGLCLFSVLFVRNIRSVASEPMYLTFAVLLLLFVAYSAAGFYGHKVVWYARLLKQFLPFLVIFTIFAIAAIAGSFRARPIVTTCIVFAVSATLAVAFALQLNAYRQYTYPKDVAWEYYNKYRFKSAATVSEYSRARPDMPNFSIVKKKFPRENAPGLVFVNVTDIYPFNDIENYHQYLPDADERLLFSGESCLNFKPYQFEAYDIWARKNLDEAKLRIKVYRKQGAR
ncbi:hypothetical protein HYN48_14605 [Flavobacterium magnum]|uniref:Glycosyltransferase RgtA/B/C/D-like domain-containing protein n=1 Tax=Flavobacterium magnum TaxID=2162713 RepID=A0A2S0RJ33_9FLAO|nr:hypothetical protein [Flavobacterium magnum]AWA31228.1 hypothetical protein HYN48_14605 [Flavobacterium magnum]